MKTKGYTVRMDRAHFLSAIIMLGFRRTSNKNIFANNSISMYIELCKNPFTIRIVSKPIISDFISYEEAYNELRELIDERDS